MLVVGLFVIAVVVYDVLTTTVSSSTRAGAITTAVDTVVWSVVTGLARREDSRLFPLAGPLIVSLSVTAWLLLLWLGWALVFSADTTAVLTSSTLEPVDLRGRFLFTAYTVFTLGYGNYLPAGGWEIVSALALINGLSLATLAVTYLVPVVTAVTDRRRQAAVISAAGATPEEIVETLHDANGFGALDQLLSHLTSEVILTGQRHLSYPVIHHYRGVDRTTAFPPSVAALDDAVTLLSVAVTGPQRPNAALTTMWRNAVDALVADAQVGRPGDAAAPPLPPVAVLDRLGVAHLDASDYTAVMQHQEERRRRLHRFVRSARWRWPA